MVTPNFRMSEDEVHALVGLDVPTAKLRVQAKGGLFRISSKDGVSLPVTADLRDDRVDVVVANGVVTHAEIG